MKKRFDFIKNNLIISLLVFILIIVILGILAYNYLPITGNAITSIKSSKSKCTDSDNTIIQDKDASYYSKGYVTYQSRGKLREINDSCYNKNTLLERYCKNKNSYSTKKVNCAQGCENGACVQCENKLGDFCYPDIPGRDPVKINGPSDSGKIEIYYLDSRNPTTLETHISYAEIGYDPAIDIDKYDTDADKVISAQEYIKFANDYFANSWRNAVVKSYFGSPGPIIIVNHNEEKINAGNPSETLYNSQTSILWLIKNDNSKSQYVAIFILDITNKSLSTEQQIKKELNNNNGLIPNYLKIYPSMLINQPCNGYCIYGCFSNTGVCRVQPPCKGKVSFLDGYCTTYLTESACINPSNYPNGYCNGLTSSCSSLVSQATCNSFSGCNWNTGSSCQWTG